MTVVYIDRVFVLNTFVDYLLLLTTAAIAGTPLRRRRFIVFSVIGGLYAAGVFLLPLLATPVMRPLIGAVIAFFAFFCDHRPWRLTALFLLLSGALAGLLLAIGLTTASPAGVLQRVYYADISWGVLLGSVGLFYVLLHLVFRQGARYGGGDTVEVTVVIGNQSCRLRALRDSGNVLRDPIHGRPVLIAEITALAGIWEKEIETVLCSSLKTEEKMAQLYGKEMTFTLFPYKAIGSDKGLLLAVRSDYLKIGRRTVPRALVALTDTRIGHGCHALWGGHEKGEEKGAEIPAYADFTAFSEERAG